MINIEASRMEENEKIDIVPDFGNFDMPELDMEAFSFMPDEDADTENRYMKPRLVPMRNEFVRYERAAELVKEIGVIKSGDRYDCLVSGSFIFGDFIEAYFVENYLAAKRMTITTLSLSQENIDSLHTLLEKGYVDELNLIVSDYFYSHERHVLIPYIYEKLDIDNKFQLAVAFVHTKTIHFLDEFGSKVVVHGSANLRTSGNVEQFTIEENGDLYNFYEDSFSPIIEKFRTINKTMPRKEQWRSMVGKK